MDCKFMQGTIIVDDIDQSLDFYQNVLGFKLVTKFYRENGGLCMLEGSDGASIELIDSKDFPTGFWSFGMHVDDFDAAIEELKEKGMELIYGPEDLPLGKLAGIEDPNGVRIMIITLYGEH